MRHLKKCKIIAISDLLKYTQLPEEMERFTSLFASCGMKEGYDLLDVLDSIRERHQDASVSDTLAVGRDLKMALYIIHKLKPTEDEILDDELRERLLIPIHW